MSIGKEAAKIKALRLFEGTALETVDGCGVLGSVIGNEKAYENFNAATARKYSNLLQKFGQEAKTSLQNAYACLTKGVQQKLYFGSRTTPNSRNIFTDAESNTQKHVLTSSFDFPVSQSEGRLYSLPNREGGRNIKEPIDYETEYAASLTSCAPVEDEDRANAHLTQERITHDQRTAGLNIFRPQSNAT